MADLRIIDNLESNDSTAALSANQGRILSTSLTSLNNEIMQIIEVDLTTAIDNFSSPSGQEIELSSIFNANSNIDILCTYRGQTLMIKSDNRSKQTGALWYIKGVFYRINYEHTNKVLEIKEINTNFVNLDTCKISIQDESFNMSAFTSGTSVTLTSNAAKFAIRNLTNKIDWDDVYLKISIYSGSASGTYSDYINCKFLCYNDGKYYFLTNLAEVTYRITISGSQASGLTIKTSVV